MQTKWQRFKEALKNPTTENVLINSIVFGVTMNIGLFIASISLFYVFCETKSYTAFGYGLFSLGMCGYNYYDLIKHIRSYKNLKKLNKSLQVL